MMKHACLLAACLSIGATSAFADDARKMHIPASPFCIAEADATAQAQAYLKDHDGARMEIITGEDAKAWIESFNTLPPVSDVRADKFWVLADPKDDGETLQIVFFLDGKTCYHTQQPAKIYGMIKHHAEETARGKSPT